MNPFNRFAERYLNRSRSALSEKKIGDARYFAKKALALDHSLVEALLIMAATSEPDESHGYLQKVLKIDPQNKKALKGISWINSFLKDSPENKSAFPGLESRVKDLLTQKESNKTSSILRRLLTRWQSILTVIAVLLIIIVAAAAPILAPVANPEGSPWFKIICERVTCFPEPPGMTLPLGSISEFDVYHTLIWGFRQSLIFGLLTASITALIGTTLGLVSAYYGGWQDKLIMRICDAFFAFPIVAGVALFAQVSILLTISAQDQRSVLMTAANSNPNFFQNIALVAADKVPNIFQNIILNADPIFLALILFSWMGYTRIIHSQVLQVKKEEYVKAARASGARSLRIIFMHILPNSITPAIVMATRDIGRMVVIQSSLTFIGVGGSSAWATLLNHGKNWIIGPGGNLLNRWWIFLPITLALVFFGVTWGFVGDELNHWMNPKNA